MERCTVHIGFSGPAGALECLAAAMSDLPEGANVRHRPPMALFVDAPVDLAGTALTWADSLALAHPTLVVTAVCRRRHGHVVEGPVMQWRGGRLAALTEAVAPAVRFGGVSFVVETDAPHVVQAHLDLRLDRGDLSNFADLRAYLAGTPVLTVEGGWTVHANGPLSIPDRAATVVAIRNGDDGEIELVAADGPVLQAVRGRDRMGIPVWRKQLCLTHDGGHLGAILGALAPIIGPLPPGVRSACVRQDSIRRAVEVVA